MRIGELASRTGVSVRSLRYYEQQGLLSSSRSSGGQRLYSDDQVARVELIQWLFNAGLSSRTIVDMLPCLDTPSADTSAAALERMALERDRLTEHIKDLIDTRDALDQLLAASIRTHTQHLRADAAGRRDPRNILDHIPAPEVIPETQRERRPDAQVPNGRSHLRPTRRSSTLGTRQ